MLVDLFERRIFEGFKGPLLWPSLVAFGQNGPVLDDLDAGELFEDPPLRSIEREFRLFRFEALVHCHHAVEFLDIGMRLERHPFNQRQDRRWTVWCGLKQWLNWPLALLGFPRAPGLVLHQHSSLSHSPSPSVRSLEAAGPLNGL